MARPQKKGLDYFPFDVDFYEDLKIEDLGNEFGPVGESIYKRILCMVYRDKGYYLPVDMQKLAIKLIKSIGNKWVRSKEQVIQVILYCADIGLFDKDLLLQSVITSVGIQRRYLKAKGRRPVIDDTYWLLDDKEPYINSPKTLVIDQKTRVIEPKTPIISPISTQRKEKKSKEKKNKLLPPGGGGCGEYSESLLLWEKINGRPITAYEGEKILALLEVFSPEWVTAAMKVAGDSGKRKLNYVEGILNRWQTDGRDGAKGGRSESFLDIAARLEAEEAKKRESDGNGTAAGEPKSDSSPGNLNRSGNFKTMAELAGEMGLPHHPECSK